MKYYLVQAWELSFAYSIPNRRQPGQEHSRGSIEFSI